jgi:hypothetical protein
MSVACNDELFSRLGIVSAATAAFLGLASVIPGEVHAAVLGSPGYDPFAVPSDWTGGPSGSASITPLVAPVNQIIMISGSNGQALFETTAKGTGTVSFGFVVAGAPNPSPPPGTLGSVNTAFFRLNGSDFAPLNPSSINASGARTFAVNIGDTFGWRFQEPSSVSTTLNLSSLSFPDADDPPAIPTPAMLPGLVGMGIAFWRKKVSGEQAETEVENATED